MKDNKQVSLIQRTLLEVAHFKKHNLNEFLIGKRTGGILRITIGLWQ